MGEGKDPLVPWCSTLNVVGGSKVKAMAKAFNSLCYEVTVLADADADDQFLPSRHGRTDCIGSSCPRLNDKCSLEERAIQDLPWANVLISVKLAQDELGFSSI